MRTLFILRGAPASGKSTWIKENNLEPYTISTDTLRLMYQSPITNNDGTRAISQNHDKEVWDMVMELLERRMQNGEFIVIDATHYKSTLINRYKDLVSKYRYRVYVIDFSNISEEELKERNSKRGFRTVPDEVIEKMVVALKDDSEVKKAYKIITPEEAKNMVEQSLEPFDANEYEKVVVFGDIHGCYEPLKEYFEKNPFNENYNYIFCGDYLDRGIQNKEVLEFLINIRDKKNCVFLEGNHETWLRKYAQKDYDIEDYKDKEVNKDFLVQKVISQLKDKVDKLSKEIRKNENTCNILSNMLREAWETNPEAREVYYQFELINVPETQKELNIKSNELKAKKERVEKYINVLRHEERCTSNYISHINDMYEEMFGTRLNLNITNVIERTFDVKVRKENPIKSKEFLDNTLPQIKDIDKSEIRRFCDKLAQMSYFTYDGHNFLVTHAGLPCMPDIKTPSIEMIKGVGKYEDIESIEKAFIKNEHGLVLQIHGHRNIMNNPITIDDGHNINLEGKIEFGGYLRIIEIGKSKEFSVFDDGNWRTLEIKNNTFKPEEKEETVQEEKTDLETLKEMYQSKWVQVKELEDDVISFNFTRDAFEKDKWDSITCHARGLFVDKTNGSVVARSFSKFFNYKQHETTEPAYMKENIKWPLIGYKKENGFLGIVSKYNEKVRFFTKSSDDGDYVNWFMGCLCDNYEIKNLSTHRYSTIYQDMINLKNNMTIEKDDFKIKECEIDIQSYKNILKDLRQRLVDKLNPLLSEGCSYVFECVDKDNDPHIIKYDSNKVILLEIFDNQLKEKHYDYEDLRAIGQALNVSVKEKALVFNNWEEFEEWKTNFRQGITQWDCKHEGYVFEDQNGYRVKFKSSFYNFWKQMRAVKMSLQKGGTNKKVYKTKEEIEVVKLMDSIDKDKLKEMSIIDVEEMYYKENK